MNDELPRPYAEAPPSAEPLSGFQLVRARPWAVAATAVLAVALTAAQVWVWLHWVPATGPIAELDASYGLVNRLAEWVFLPFLGALPLLVPLVVIAALAGRRVTVGRALALWAFSALLSIVENLLIMGAFLAVYGGAGSDGTTVVLKVIEIGWLVLAAVAARRLLPLPGYPLMRGPDLVVIVVASVAVMLVTMPLGELGLNRWAGTALWALLVMVWSFAVLVTSAPKGSAWSGTPADLRRQDP
ncbi:hypothetical protein AB0G04_01025 [Actinoplanes sp. NPDC023801]|uniref:hypothetical protein n=1 Tax=Actinoplanes sp. NPDC023801 TaxID=3154595 RepID=UPI0033DE8510